MVTHGVTPEVAWNPNRPREELSVCNNTAICELLGKEQVVVDLHQIATTSILSELNELPANAMITAESSSGLPALHFQSMLFHQQQSQCQHVQSQLLHPSLILCTQLRWNDSPCFDVYCRICNVWRFCYSYSPEIQCNYTHIVPVQQLKIDRDKETEVQVCTGAAATSNTLCLYPYAHSDCFTRETNVRIKYNALLQQNSSDENTHSSSAQFDYEEAVVGMQTKSAEKIVKALSIKYIKGNQKVDIKGIPWHHLSCPPHKRFILPWHFNFNWVNIHSLKFMWRWNRAWVTCNQSVPLLIPPGTIYGSTQILQLWLYNCVFLQTIVKLLHCQPCVGKD